MPRCILGKQKHHSAVKVLCCLIVSEVQSTFSSKSLPCLGYTFALENYCDCRMLLCQVHGGTGEADGEDLGQGYGEGITKSSPKSKALILELQVYKSINNTCIGPIPIHSTYVQPKGEYPKPFHVLPHLPAPATKPAQAAQTAPSHVSIDSTERLLPYSFCVRNVEVSIQILRVQGPK